MGKFKREKEREKRWEERTTEEGERGNEETEGREEKGKRGRMRDCREDFKSIVQDVTVCKVFN